MFEIIWVSAFVLTTIVGYKLFMAYAEEEYERGRYDMINEIINEFEKEGA